MALAELEAHVNRCLDQQQAQQDEQIAATLGRDEQATSVTVPYRPQQWVSLRQPDPDAEEALKRSLPPIITTPTVPPVPPPAITVPLPAPPVAAQKAPAPPPKERVVFDADASNGWVEAVRTEIVRAAPSSPSTLRRR